MSILGWLQLALGLLDLLMAVLLFGLFAGVGALVSVSGEPSGVLLGGTLGAVLGGLVALTALPNLFAGVGLLRRRNWGRILALVLAVLNGLKFPWGTAFAVYTVWALTRDDVEDLFA